MTRVLLVLALVVMPVTLAFIAGTLALKGMGGWGWFLFAAIVSTGGSAKFGGSADDKAGPQP